MNDTWFVILLNDDGTLKAGPEEDTILEFETLEEARLREAEERDDFGQNAVILPMWMWETLASAMTFIQAASQGIEFDDGSYIQVVADDDEPTYGDPDIEYHPDCPYCLRDQPHTHAEHDRYLTTPPYNGMP